MSDTKDDTGTASQSDDSTVPAQTADAETVDPESPDNSERTDAGTPPARAARRGFSGLPGLLLALVALAAAGALWFQQQGFNERIEQAAQEAAAAAQAADSARDDADDLAEMRERLDALGSDMDAQRRDLSRLDETTQRALAGLRDDMSEWPVRLGDLEDSIAALRGVSDDARRRWLRAEAEYFLNIANTELQLAADIGRATQALELADARLRQIDEPGLNPVRAAIAAELTALGAVPTVDRAGISLRLASLARQVDALPLPQPAPGLFERGTPVGTDEASPGLDRAWRALRRALSNMVSVRRDDSPVSPQLSPEEGFFLRRNLEVQIENARMALLRRERGLYRDHLDSAAGWLEAWFDVTDPAVASVQATLEELAAIDIAPALPAVDDSLRRLRDYTRAREREPSP
ncbi:MAG: uroporphyrinogen-III C-methyltransferase [Gammaproteobacteria bacterium]|nr:uroporphyrinogen-III C-methyltransferase [Gammaproteobacteria bacterium]